jgi:hypothetical protein
MLWVAHFAPISVIPAKAGIHFALAPRCKTQKSKWIPAFAGMTK